MRQNPLLNAETKQHHGVAFVGITINCFPYVKALRYNIFFKKRNMRIDLSVNKL